MDETASSNPILQRIDDRGVAYITLNRPEVYNGYNGEMIAALLAAFDKLAHEPLRVAVIKGSGRNFQAADINWLTKCVPYRCRSSPIPTIQSGTRGEDQVQSTVSERSVGSMTETRMIDLRSQYVPFPR